MATHNRELADLFEQMADAVEISGGNRFRVAAFQRAARVLGELSRDVADYSASELKDIEGIGKGTADRIREYLDTGKIAEHDELAQKVPAGVRDLMEVPGLGPKSAARLWRELGIESRDGLKEAIDTGKLAELDHFGDKTIANLKKNLAFAQAAGRRARLGNAMTVAQALVDHLRGLTPVKRIEYAGSLRRGKETIGDADILVAADPQHGWEITDAFVAAPGVSEVLLRGETKTSIRMDPDHGGLQVDLRVIEPDAFGAALLYFTGSKGHNVRLRERAQSKGMKLSEYGLFKESSDTPLARKTEEAVYHKLGLAWIPPELREDRDEIALAVRDELPELIELGDVKADLHTHTEASDGVWSIEENARAMARRGYHTLAITDHSKSQVQAHGLSVARMRKHLSAIHKVADKLEGTIRVLAGAEVDILSDGKLDYPDSLLKAMDFVVASPHAALSQDSQKATDRLRRAIDNKYIHVIGHPTGRLVGKREGLSPDMEKITRAAADRGIALEVNANHMRLDLRDAHARLALEARCKLSVNTDAHGPQDPKHMRYGILTARRAGATKKDVINAMTQKQLAKWIASARP